MLKVPEPVDRNGHQKQKKRLSFKEPEVEGRRGSRSRIYEESSTSTLEDGFILQNHLLQLDHISPSEIQFPIEGTGSEGYFLYDHNGFDAEVKETEINDCFLEDDDEYARNLIASAEHSTMRCPANENADVPDSESDHIPLDETERVSSGAQHQIQLLRYQLEQREQQHLLQLHQLQLLSDQLEAESSARQKSQDQNNQLMFQNQELLSHIEKLFQQIEDLEKQLQVYKREEKASKLFHAQKEPQLRVPPSCTRRLSDDPVASRLPAHSLTAPMRKSSLTITKQSHYTQVRPMSQIQTFSKTTNPTQQPKQSTIPAQSKLQTRGPLQTSKTSQPMSKSPAVAKNPTRPLSMAQSQVSKLTGQFPATKSISVPRPKSLCMNSAKTIPMPSNQMSMSSSDFSSGGLHIGDTTPPVKNSSQSPFGWRQENPTDKPTYSRSRTGSFSSFSKYKPIDATKCGILYTNNQPSVSTAGNKKYSSSTSDLYNSLPANKSDEQSMDAHVRSSSPNVIASSKLARYNTYNPGWKKTAGAKIHEQSSLGIKDMYNKKVPDIVLRTECGPQYP